MTTKTVTDPDHRYPAGHRFTLAEVDAMGTAGWLKNFARIEAQRKAGISFLPKEPSDAF